MEHSSLQALPLGISDFEELRKQNFVYVDKTDLIHRLAQIRTPLFLSRPRRFGKTLLVSTFETLFRQGLSSFAGLKIEKLWTEIDTYKVIRLDLSRLKNCESVAHFRQLFRYELLMSFQLEGLSLPESGMGPTTDFDMAVRQSKEPLVLLIDEYDSPLTSLVTQPSVFEAIQTELSRFFDIVKANTKKFRFVFMTGITRFNHTGIFSGFNNLRDISLDTDFGTILGYTEDEIRAHFASHLQNARSVLSLSQENLLEKLRFHYDGYSFDEMAKTHVYSPWSVLSFLAAPHRRFKNYWFDTGSRPSILLNDLSIKPQETLEQLYQEQTLNLSALSGSADYRQMPLSVLLTQTGYLTIKAADREGENVILGFPNEEVRQSMAQLYADILLNLNGRSFDIAYGKKIFEAICSRNIESLVQIFNDLFSRIDYLDWSNISEGICRNYCTMLIAASGFHQSVSVEKHNAYGRSDLEFSGPDADWVVEFKLARDGDDPQRMLQTAVEQIRQRHYGERISGNALVRIAMVFSKQERRIKVWQIL